LYDQILILNKLIKLWLSYGGDKSGVRRVIINALTCVCTRL